jgi:hypothetical protein
MEEFMDWIIDEHGLAVDFLSSRVAKMTLKAIIYPDIEKLYNFLYDAQIVRCSLQEVLDFEEQIHCSCVIQKGLDDKNEGESMNCSMECLNLLCDFGISNTHSLTEEETSLLFISSIDRSFFYVRLMKKIKKAVKQYPDLRLSIVSLIKKKGLWKVL